MQSGWFLATISLTSCALSVQPTVAAPLEETITAFEEQAQASEQTVLQVSDL